jgi:hypothetical protein
MDPRQLLGALTQIVQQLNASGVPQEVIMSAIQGGGQQPQPGMGAGPGPDLPPGIPRGGPPMPQGGGMPPGILGAG